MIQHPWDGTCVAFGGKCPCDPADGKCSVLCEAHDDEFEMAEVKAALEKKG